MAKADADPTKGAKMYSADVVAAVLMATGTTSLSMKIYELISALDGTKTASGFQHDFRIIIAKAKDLKARVDGGEVFEPVQPTKKRSEMSSPATPRKRKTTATSDEDDTPTKKKPKAAPKPKATPKPRGKKAAQVDEPGNDFGGGDEFPQDADDFIKSEREWENEFV